MDKQALMAGSGKSQAIYWAVEWNVSKESEALCQALRWAGEDESRVESMGKAYSAPCGAPELGARLYVLNSALVNHRDYYVALSLADLPINGTQTPVPSCYADKDEVVLMTNKMTNVIGRAWLISWSQCWNAVGDLGGRGELIDLAHILLDQVEVRPMPEGHERVVALLSSLGQAEVESLIQASTRVGKEKCLENARPFLSARRENQEIKSALCESDSFEPKRIFTRL